MLPLPTNSELANLGIPFALYQAPLSTMDCYVGGGICSLEGIVTPHRFRLGIGDYIIVPCPKCRTEVALDADDGAAGHCPTCQTRIAFPPVHPDEEELAACYDCLRAGRVAITHDTEFGMVRWEDAMRALTHGTPGLNEASLGNNPFEIGAPFEDGGEEEEWRGVVVPSPILLELVRTPSYSTWQGDTWFFHCGQVMIYLGTWNPHDFARARPSDPKSLFAELTGPDGFTNSQWSMLGSDSASCYVHGCAACGKLRAYVDFD